jgi:predicted metalloprotease with PDZ domain
MGTAVTLARDTMPGTPLYEAQLARGDRIVSLGRFRIESQADWTAALARHRPGERAEIRFAQRGRERVAQLVLAADPTVEIVRSEAAGGTVTPAQRAFRDDWLGAQEQGAAD